MAMRQLILAFSISLVICAPALSQPIVSYPPLRSLPSVSVRAMDSQPARFVDPQKSQKPLEVDVQVDGNLFWGLADGLSFQKDYFGKFRQSNAFEESKSRYAPGWTANDRFANPKFDVWDADRELATQLTLGKDSPAVNAGVAIPQEWPDSLRAQDKDAPDIGAIPLGAKPWKVGVRGGESS